MLVALALGVATWGGDSTCSTRSGHRLDRARLPPFRRPSGAQTLNVARALHIGTVLCLAAVGAATFGAGSGGSFYALGVAVAAGLLVYEHSLVKSDDFSRSTPPSSR